MQLKLIALSLVFVLGLILRVAWLGARPAGFTWDEAALGYNAYSLLQTGRDEHKQILPIVFKSFGDYKPGLYIYFTTPSIAMLGLSEFATRLPSAVVGSLGVILVFLLVENFRQKYAILAAMLMAINPWALNFSRGAWEVNLFVTLLLLGIVLVIKQRFYLAFLFLGLTFWTYQGAKLFTPLLAFSILWLFRPSLKSLSKPLLLLLLLLLPIVWGLRTQSGRLKVFSVFSYQRPEKVIQVIRDQDGGNKVLFSVFHGEWFDQLRGVIQRYLNYLSPRFLFFEGDWTNLRHSTVYTGYLYLPEILTLVVGTVWFIKTKSSFSRLMGLWLALAILPAALSRDLVTGVRSLPMVVPLVIVSAAGWWSLTKTKWLWGVWTVLLTLFVIRYLDLYYFHQPKFAARDWLWAYKPAIQSVLREETGYSRVVFTTEMGQPYIFVLFYGRISPVSYWQTRQVLDNPSGDVGEVLRFGNYDFKSIYWPSDRGLTNTLFVGGQFALPEIDLANTTRIGDILLPNGEHALRLVGTL